MYNKKIHLHSNLKGGRLTSNHTALVDMYNKKIHLHSNLKCGRLTSNHTALVDMYNKKIHLHSNLKGGRLTSNHTALVDIQYCLATSCWVYSPKLKWGLGTSHLTGALSLLSADVLCWLTRSPWLNIFIDVLFTNIGCDHWLNILIDVLFTNIGCDHWLNILIDVLLSSLQTLAEIVDWMYLLMSCCFVYKHWMWSVIEHTLLMSCCLVYKHH